MPEVLEEIEGGNLKRDLVEQLQALAVAVQSLGKPGSVTVKFTVKPKNYKSVQVDTSLSSTFPKPDREMTSLFVTTEGRLMSRDPDQPSLYDLRSLDSDEEDTEALSQVEE